MGTGASQPMYASSSPRDSPATLSAPPPQRRQLLLLHGDTRREVSSSDRSWRGSNSNLSSLHTGNSVSGGSRYAALSRAASGAAVTTSAAAAPSSSSSSSPSHLRRRVAPLPRARDEDAAMDWSAALHKLQRRTRGNFDSHDGSAHASTSANGGDVSVLTRHADAVSLQLLQQLHDVEQLPATTASDEVVRRLHACHPLLARVPGERVDQLTMMVLYKEAEVQHRAGDVDAAKALYAQVIRLAEQRVARQAPDMYVVLKRYVLAMVGLARIWYAHERQFVGFTFVDRRHPRIRVAAVAATRQARNKSNNNDDDDDRLSQLSLSSIESLESTLSSDGGSVFSLNRAILRAAKPRPPRRRTGPALTRVKLNAPRLLKATLDREDEFVLHSNMTRELVASPCELLLLRCCEVVEIGLSCQSELLLPPLLELAQLYESLQLYSRALLLVRRCMGTLCSVFDYDHPWVVQLHDRARRLTAALEQQRRAAMATKIQATWRMHRARRALEQRLGHRVRRHVQLQQQQQQSHTTHNHTSSDRHRNGAQTSNATTTSAASRATRDRDASVRAWSTATTTTTSQREPQQPSSFTSSSSSPQHGSRRHHEHHHHRHRRTTEQGVGADAPSKYSKQQRNHGGSSDDASGFLSHYLDECVPMHGYVGNAATAADGDDAVMQANNNNNNNNNNDDNDTVAAAQQTTVARYDALRGRNDVGTFAMAVPRATVVGNTQDTTTDTFVQHTELGEVLTIRTTTVTKTVTERLVHSDSDSDAESDDDDDDSNGSDRDRDKDSDSDGGDCGVDEHVTDAPTAARLVGNDVRRRSTHAESLPPLVPQQTPSQQQQQQQQQQHWAPATPHSLVQSLNQVPATATASATTTHMQRSTMHSVTGTTTTTKTATTTRASSTSPSLASPSQLPSLVVSGSDVALATAAAAAHANAAQPSSHKHTRNNGAATVTTANGTSTLSPLATSSRTSSARVTQ